MPNVLVEQPDGDALQRSRDRTDLGEDIDAGLSPEILRCRPRT